MGYKKMDQNIGFADFALASSMKHNRSLKNMEKLNKAINWSRVEEILMNHYTVGTSNEGADAYPPILLFKCLMLQKWFHISSDPELENQINDRWSFKEFLNFPLSKPSPDHSTFSRFRSRLTKNAMDQINSEILRQFENQLPRRKRTGYERGIILFLSPHPTPLPRERELAETPPQADGV